MDLPIRDRLFVALDESPLAQLSRLAFGSAVVPLWARLARDEAADWTLVLFFLGALAMLRVVPLAVRMAIPFGDATKTIWAERRQLAKRYDCYQWQKMLWIGLGMLATAVVTGERSAVVLSLAAVCVLSGAAGSIVWRRRNTPGAAAGANPRVLREPAQCS
jgi:LPXTG-motif cell wall-anchored protein